MQLRTGNISDCANHPQS